VDHLISWNLEQWRPLGAVWFSPGSIPSQLFLLLGGVFLGGCLCQWIPSKQRKFIFRFFVFSYLSRVIVSYILYLFSFFSKRPGAFLGADDYVYMYNGLGLSRLLDAGVKVDFYRGMETFTSSMTEEGSFGIVTHLPYTLYNVFLFQWLGNHPLSVLITNCLMGAILIFPLFFLGKELFNSESGKIAAVCGAFYPSAFLWSTQNLKEPVFNLMVVLLFLVFVRFRKTYNLIHLILIGVSTYLIGLIRSPIHWLLIGGLLIGWIVSSRRVLIAVIIAISLACFSYPGLVKRQIERLSQYVLLVSNTGQNEVQKNYALMKGETPSLIRGVNQLREVRSLGTAFLPELSLDRWESISYLWPVLLMITLTVPYPWQMTRLTVSFGAMEMILWYFLIPATLWGIGYSLKKQFSLTLSLLIPIVVYAVVIGFLDANIGLLVRQRGIVLLNLFIFTGAGFVYKKRLEESQRNQNPDSLGIV